MAGSTFPVDLFNPGQVFACLGLMEVADVLMDDVEAGFDWSDPRQPIFRIEAAGEQVPVRAVLDYLAHATVGRVMPRGYSDPPKQKSSADAGADADEADDDGSDEAGTGDGAVARTTPGEHEYSECFPAAEADSLSLPVRLFVEGRSSVEVSHWADGSTRNTFKLYAGNRSAEGIARAMLLGVRDKPKKGKTKGALRYKGVEHLWAERPDEIEARPFDLLTPIGGSFNFDPRGAWTALDAGYSPNTHKHGVVASPLVHLLAACGLEHTRPMEFGVRQVRYCVWTGELPPSLARVAFQGGIPSLPTKQFRFELALSGKNKIVTFAQQENAHERR